MNWTIRELNLIPDHRQIFKKADMNCIWETLILLLSALAFYIEMAPL